MRAPKHNLTDFLNSLVADKAKLYILIATAILAVCVVWASTANVDQIVHASGRVVATAGTQLIQAADGGILADIKVKEGQEVAAGDVLAELQKARADAAYSDTRAKVAALRATLVRLHAEVYSRALEFDAELKEYPEFVQNQTDLFRRRQQALNQGVAAMEKSLSIAQAELGTVTPLVSKGDIGMADVLKLRRQVADLEGQIVNMKNKYFQDAQAEMAKVEEELTTREQEFADRKELLSHTNLTAPVDGVVRSINIRTIGGTVRQGDVVMQLVPKNTDLVFEAKLKPADVGFVMTGAPAAIKLDAFDYSIYGVMRGEVTFISPDAITENTPRGEESYYLIRINIHRVGRFKDLDIQPGITGVVDVITGQKTVLAYLTKPVLKTFKESLRER